MKLSKVFFFFFFLTLSFSSFYGASYIDPTPEIDAKLWAQVITIKVYEEDGDDISDCFIRINGTEDDSMTYQSPYCYYNFTNFPDLKATTSYEVFYSGTDETLGERNFTYYPRAVENQIPAFGFGSLIITLLLIVFGGYLRR